MMMGERREDSRRGTVSSAITALLMVRADFREAS